MSIDMYLEQSQNQAYSAWTMADSEMLAYAQIRVSLSEFEASADQLKGKAFDSAREYSSAVLHPLVRGGYLLAEAIGTAIKRFPEAYVEQVTAESLKESELETDIAALDSQITLANQHLLDLVKEELSIGNSRLVKSYQNTIDIATESRQLLQDKLDKLRAFNASSPSIFKEISNLKGFVNQGLAQLSTGWDAQRGVYVLPTNLNWAANINKLPMSPRSPMDDLTREELDWIKILMEQYGFDMETAQLIVDVKRGIDKKFPKMSQEDKDYLLNRVLGAPIYNGFQWDNTAGDLKDYFSELVYEPGMAFPVQSPLSIKEIFQELGLSEAEFNKLYYEIRKQYDFSALDKGVVIDPTATNYEDRLKLYIDTHDVSGMTRAEIEAAFRTDWLEQNRRYADKTDFAHQMITTATHLNPGFPLAALGFAGRGGLEEVAGWRGDATKDAEAEPSMGNDDYRADLDAVNISAIMEEQNLSYVAAANYYYNHLEDTPSLVTPNHYTRAEIFLQNVDYNHVKEELYDLVPDSASGREKYHSPRTGMSFYEEPTEEQKRAYLKEHYPDSYQFLISLENKSNELK
ncbi:hypothetical protein ACVRYP_03615 [Streptococcus rifensis]